MGYGYGVLAGMTLAIWDADTGVLEFAIRTNTSSSGTMTITLEATTGLDAIDDENDAEYCIVFDEEIYHYHTNIQGNVVAMTDDDGLVVEEYEYDLYGRLDICHGVGRIQLISGIRARRVRGYGLVLYRVED